MADERADGSTGQATRISRDDAMLAAASLVAIAGLVKKYVKSLYGADPPRLQQISVLEFTRPR